MDIGGTIKALEKRRKELELEAESLKEQLDRGEITKEEYNRRMKELKREFIEVMDRLTQLKFIAGELFTS